jgi:LPS sulfotransferase NodH
MRKPAERLTRFVILAAPRTGSNMLCTLLNSHPEILCHHELFNPGDIYYALPLRDGSFNLGTMQERDGDPLAFLDSVWRANLDYPCVGFKLTYRQNETVFRAVLNDQEVKKIVLRRKNHIKTFVSMLISEETGQWEVYSESDLIQARPKVQVDWPALCEFIAFNDAYYGEIESALESSNQTFLRVAYENLFSDEERLMILKFLGVTPAPYVQRVESIKQNSSDLRNLIANFAELEATLQGSGLEAELRSTDW